MKSLITLFLFLFFSEAGSANPSKILILGDSLTEGFGIEKTSAFPHQLSLLLTKSFPKKSYSVINAGISGSTSASCKKRLIWYLKAKPQVLVLALGANDGLRGVSYQSTKSNLEQCILLAKKSKLKIVLAGMKVPPNYGKDYSKNFDAIFITLAKEYKLVRIPFLLEGVAGEPKLNLADGIHPNESGHIKIAQHILKYLKEVL